MTLRWGERTLKTDFYKPPSPAVITSTVYTNIPWRLYSILHSLFLRLVILAWFKGFLSLVDIPKDVSMTLCHASSGVIRGASVFRCSDGTGIWEWGARSHPIKTPPAAHPIYSRVPARIQTNPSFAISQVFMGASDAGPTLVPLYTSTQTPPGYLIPLLQAI